MAKPRADAPVTFEAQRMIGTEIDEFVDDPDAETAWDGWISDLKRSASSGLIRVAKLPTDEKGNALPNAKGQIQLGAWPHDQYDYDGLLAHIRANFMKPGETCHIRITGLEPGKPGVKVNQIVTLQRPASSTPVEAASSQLGEILGAMREDRAATHTLLKEVMDKQAAPPPPPPSILPTVEKVGVLLSPILAAAVTAWIGRPAKPQSDIGALIGAMRDLKDMTDGSTGERDDDSTVTSIIKAVAPQGLQLLNTLVQGQQRATHAATVSRSAPQPIAAHVISGAPSVAPTTVRDTNGAPPSSPTSVSTVSTASDALASSSLSTETPAMFAALKPHLEELCLLAEQQADPVEVAKLTVSLLPPELEDRLANVIEDPQKFKLLGALVPKMKQHADWFESLRAALEKELFDDAPEEIASAK